MPRNTAISKQSSVMCYLPKALCALKKFHDQLIFQYHSSQGQEYEGSCRFWTIHHRVVQRNWLNGYPKQTHCRPASSQHACAWRNHPTWRNPPQPGHGNHSSGADSAFTAPANKLEARITFSLFTAWLALYVSADIKNERRRQKGNVVKSCCCCITNPCCLGHFTTNCTKLWNHTRKQGYISCASAMRTTTVAVSHIGRCNMTVAKSRCAFLILGKTACAVVRACPSTRSPCSYKCTLWPPENTTQNMRSVSHRNKQQPGIGSNSSGNNASAPSAADTDIDYAARSFDLLFHSLLSHGYESCYGT